MNPARPGSAAAAKRFPPILRERKMRNLLVPAVVSCLFLAGSVSRADDDVKTILDKAIKAHGGAEKLGKHTGSVTKTKGTIDLAGGIDFIQEMTLKSPNKFKESIQMTVMGKTFTVTSAYDGEKAWIDYAGTNIDVNEKLMAEFKEQAYMMSIGDLSGLSDKKLELSLLGEVQVEGKPAVGVKVASKGHRDISLFFDKASSMLVKVEHLALDASGGQDVMQERIIQEYQELNGVKVAKKIHVNRDGKKFMEAEVLEVKYLDKLDDNEFVKP
jgi:hypothetical protein